MSSGQNSWQGPARRFVQWALVASTTGYALSVLLRQANPGPNFALDTALLNVGYFWSGLACWLRPPGRDGRGWRCLGLACWIVALGNIFFSVLLAQPGSLPYPSVADAFFLAWYPLLYVALLLLLRSRIRDFLASMWLDGIVAGLGTCSAALGLLVGPLLHLTADRPAAVLTNLGYPIADLILLVVLAATAAALGTSVDRPLGLVLAGVFLTGVADLSYLLEGSQYQEGRWVDIIWLLGTALFGFAAYLGPAKDELAVAPSAGPTPVRVRWSVLALPALAMVMSVALLLGLPTSAQAARLLAAACIVLGLARVALSFREVRDLTHVHRQARTDELTGLPNRRAMYELCEQLLDNPAQLTLLLIDLDRFKDINDALGHTVGDQLLIDVGQRIRRSTPVDSAVCRLGGDEFAVLLPGRSEAEGAAAAWAIRQGLTTGVELSGITVHVQASIGVAVADPAAIDGTSHQISRTELLRRADVAMYEAKGRNLAVLGYSSVDSGQAVDRLITVSDLRRLVLDADPRAGELVVHLQPQLQLTDRTVCGAEALVRWLHPDRGLVPPLVFLPAAEAAGLMGPLTEKVLDLALSACAQWWADGHRFPVAVNVSAANVHDRDLPHKVTAALERHGLPARALTLEVTEDALMTDPAAARSRLDEIRALGAAASIDDYGSGYSSLGYLRDLSVDELKIDRSFINRLVTRGPCTDIVRHTVEMAQALGLRTVAEGVDDELIVQVLTQLGCDIAQGFHIARPMPQRDFLAWLARQPTVGHPFARSLLTADWR